VTRIAVREITSPSNPLIKEIRALHLKKRRDESGLFLAEGARTVMEALDCGVAPKTVIYARDAASNEVVASLRDRTIAAGGEALEVGPAILEKLARKDNPQSLLGVFAQRYGNFATFDPERTISVVLEGVKDPGNLGTVIRTVDSVGGGGVVLIGNTCDPFSTEAVRASMGSIFSVPVFRASLDAFAQWRRSFQGLVVGTALQTDTDYRAVRYRQPALLLIGSEQAGLSREARALCDALVKLPMKGRADSLNLAVATGVMLYHMDASIEA
jgi:TrmH family RNA methyltransferase